MGDTGRRSKRSRRRTKDRVLQARIPEDLDEHLRDRAERLGLSVSTVVRNVLLHTFDLVEGVVTDSAEVARVVQGRGTPGLPPALSAPSVPTEPEAESAVRPEEHAVIAWQQVVLNRNGVCDQCNVILAKGESAAVGVPVQVRPVLLCNVCLEKLSSGDDHDPAFTLQQAPELPEKASGRRKKKDTH